MSVRPHVVLRDADREDAAGVIALWRDCVGDGDSGNRANTSALWREPGVAEAAAALDQNFGDGYRRMVVALAEGEIVGAICFQIITLTPINLTKVLLVTELQVAPSFRRQSVASTLLSAAANVGEEANCEVVLTISPASAREPNRFLAKLGFGQVSVIRGAQASLLRAKLSTKATKSKDTGKLIAVRRTMRRRQAESRRLRQRQ